MYDIPEQKMDINIKTFKIFQNQVLLTAEFPLADALFEEFEFDEPLEALELALEALEEDELLEEALLFELPDDEETEVATLLEAALLPELLLTLVETALLLAELEDALLETELEAELETELLALLDTELLALFDTELLTLLLELETEELTLLLTLVVKVLGIIYQDVTNVLLLDPFADETATDELETELENVEDVLLIYADDEPVIKLVSLIVCFKSL